jgi:hypothetical protein
MTKEATMNTEEKGKTMEENRPEFVTDEHLRFLDELRESGEINMFGAAPYLSNIFDLSEQEARKALTYWMQTFANRKQKADPQTEKERDHER